MTAPQIMAELKSLGSPAIKNILLRHGVREPLFGVRVGDMRPIVKKIRTDYQLAKELFATGNADAMYLAGLVADDSKMTKADLHAWVKQALSNNISEYTVPWVTAGNKHGFELALEWIDSAEEHIAAAGWSTLANIVSLVPDVQLDMSALKSLLARVGRQIHTAPNRVRYTMNTYVICLGAYIKPLSTDAIATAKKMGAVTVQMDGTACKVPSAPEYIQKAIGRGSLGKKKKTVKC